MDKTRRQYTQSIWYILARFKWWSLSFIWFRSLICFVKQSLELREGGKVIWCWHSDYLSCKEGMGWEPNSMITEILLKVVLNIITLTLTLMVTEILVSIAYSQLIELDNKHHSYRKPTISIFIITKLCFSKTKQVHVVKPETSCPGRVWRYQRDNQNPYIEEERRTQWPNEKVQRTINDLQNIHIKLKI